MSSTRAEEPGDPRATARGRVELVDEFTGRVADNRRWPHGIQSAVEAKEGGRLWAL